MRTSSLREEIRKHKEKVEKIRDEFPLGNLLNQYEFARRNGDMTREAELVMSLEDELVNLGRCKMVNDLPKVLSLKSNQWIELHDPVWGIVHYAEQITLKEVTRVLTLERASRLLKKNIFVSSFKDDIEYG